MRRLHGVVITHHVVVQNHKPHPRQHRPPRRNIPQLRLLRPPVLPMPVRTHNRRPLPASPNRPKQIPTQPIPRRSLNQNLLHRKPVKRLLPVIPRPRRRPLHRQRLQPRRHQYLPTQLPLPLLPSPPRHPPGPPREPSLKKRRVRPHRLRQPRILRRHRAKAQPQKRNEEKYQGSHHPNIVLPPPPPKA